MKSIGRVAGVAASMGALTLALAFPTTGTANASTPDQVTFTWRGYLTAGSCTIEPGATWTLYSDGTARLDATVSSLDDDDAWLMWAHLLDERKAVIDDIRVYRSSSTKFVKNLPSHARSYRWIARGQFDPAIFDLVKHMSLGKHC
ncbi:DUF6294 family protein [Nonomuraea pusilla]|uniref:DUF6294 family protein n=1 Tax=Nonomuraea pusilla TaxID=46177 RepID=UPI003319C827